MPNGEPFLGASQTTLAEAEAALGHLPRPADPKASDASIATVWINTNSREVAIDFESGMREFISVAAGGGEGSAQRIVDSLPGEGMSVQTVDGVEGALVVAGNFQGNCPTTITNPPASLVQAWCAPAQRNPTSVTFMLGDLAIQLNGPGDWSTDTLIGIANTIK